MSRRKALVVAPGRGTYNKAELGYLARHHGDKAALIAGFDAQRAALGQPTLGELDGAESFSGANHTRGDNASALIFASSYGDYLAIDRERFDVVAVTGNSMGWYTALACAGALDAENGFALANDMGRRMHAEGVGGQVIHTTLDDNWQPIPGRRAELMALVAAIPDLYVSIELGGMVVLAGSNAALKAFAAEAPSGPGQFPMGLANHAAFHSPLLTPIAQAARAAHAAVPFGQPTVPLIDGRGQLWQPLMSDPAAMLDYTLGHQVTRTYDFTRAIAVGLREFAPDCLIVLGPGETLGGAVIQSLLAANWHGWDSKAAYLAAQGDEPFVLAMGRADQRGLVSR